MKTNLRKWGLGSLKALTVLAMAAASSNAYSQCPTTITVDDTSTCFGDTLGALSIVPVPAGAPIMITEADRNSPDLIEIQNVTGAAFDVTGYYVACSNSYTDINIPNSLTWQLTGVQAAGWIDYRIDNTGANYWGNNLFFSGASPGWVAICDASHNVIDIFFWEWSAADIATFAPTVAGNTLILDPAQWTGDGLTGGCSTGSMTRSTNIENNDASDWTCGSSATAGISNITITPATGDPITSVLWSTMETTMSITGLTAGTYGVVVNYQSGCVGTDSLTLVAPAQLTGAATTTDILCFGDSNGTASVVASGGTGAINVDWGANDPNMLGQGYAAYSMTDAAGCTEMDSVLINEPTAVDLSLTGSDVPCFGDTVGGSADAAVTGGTPGYTYTWSSGDTTSAVSGLSTGWYSVTVADSNGCSVQDSVEIMEPTVLTLSGTTSDEISGTDGSIDLTVGGGTPPYTYSWTNGAPSVEDPTGLAGGSYDVTVTDANGCTITDTYVVNSQVGIDELNSLQFNVTPNPNNGDFQLALDPSVGSANVEILNSLGQIIYADEILTSEKNISLESVNMGVYFVRVYNSTSSKVMRVVIK
jgi:hypothetical protein